MFAEYFILHFILPECMQLMRRWSRDYSNQLYIYLLLGGYAKGDDSVWRMMAET